jgi:hypothetical protein
MGWVYFIACPETMRLKIGFTSGDVHARLRALQTGSPTNLSLVACHPGSMDDEKKLHERFDEHRIHGEWFSMSEELFEYLSMIVWITAVDAQIKGRPLDRWVRVGLESLHETHPLPTHMAAML